MKAIIIGLLLVASALALPAAVSIGSTREDVIAMYGPPKGSTKAGAKEILLYTGGQVWLESGLVVKYDHGIAAVDPAPAAPAPEPAAVAEPVVPAAVTAPHAVVPARDPWFTDFAVAKAEAGAKQKRLLVLFTGSDWCPPCMEFEAQVAHHPDFLDFARVPFVLVKLDYPRNTVQPPALRQQNERLLRKYRITAYPTLVVMSADGGKTLRVNTRKARPASDRVEYFLQAVDEARKEFDHPKSWWWPF